MSAVPVLMYHSVSDDPPPATRALSVRPAAFAAQMQHLHDSGCTALTFGEYTDAVRFGAGLPERPVVVTFDDGYADTAQRAVPVLARWSMPATVFVTTGWIADAGADAAGTPLDATMTWSQLADLEAAGIEVAAHTHSHPHLDLLPDGALADELQRSRALLEDRLSAHVTTMAYPFGHSSRRVRRQAELAGFGAAAAVENRLPGDAPDLYRVPRLTIRRATTPEEFARLVDGRGLLRSFAGDRVLTNGYRVVRAARSVRRGR